jgi:ferric-dicitrate binding protein FerR (iron transport regulator)
MSKKERIMQKTLPMICAVVVFMICTSAAKEKPMLAVKLVKGEAQVTYVKGAVEAVCPGQKEIRTLKINDRIQAGCEVTTGADSRLELLLPDRSVVRFAEKTAIKLLSADVSEDGKRSIGISVGVGKIWMNVRKSLQGGGDKFDVSCQNAVAGVRGTVYRMDVENDQSAVVKVYEGEVNVAAPVKKAALPGYTAGPPKPVAGPTKIPGPKSVTMEEWTYIVKSMQQIKISADGKAQPPKAFTDAEDMDAWVKWNKRKDKEVNP